MTVATAFAELEKEFKRLDEAASNVSWAVVQVRPSTPTGSSIADRYESMATDFSNLVRVAREAAREGQRATVDHGDPIALRSALVTCQECAIQLTEQYYGGIASCERIGDLDDLATRGGRDWREWVIGVRDNLSGHPEMLHSLSQALLRCWQEITEPIGPMSVSAQATNIGPRIVIRGGRYDEDIPQSEQPADDALRIDTS